MLSSTWLRNLAILLIYSFLVLVSGGCRGIERKDTSFNKVFIMEGHGLAVFRGTYVTNHIEGEYGVVRYRAHKFLVPASMVIELEVAYYEKTRTTPLPASALLVLKWTQNAQIELFGMDASRSILLDSPENLTRIGRVIGDGQLISKPETWLPKTEAINLAKRALGDNVEPDRYEFKAERYEFGWRVFACPREKPFSFGEERHVVIGDDAKVKLLSGGL